MEDKLKELEALSLYNPKRFVILQDVLAYEFGPEDERILELKQSLENKDISIIYLHKASRAVDRDSFCDFKALILIRQQLLRLYHDLRVCNPLTIEQLVDNAFACMSDVEKEEEFWKWYKYLNTHLESNNYDFSSRVDVCKKCLYLEGEYFKRMSELKNKSHLQHLEAFGRVEPTHAESAIDALKCYFLKKECTEYQEDVVNDKTFYLYLQEMQNYCRFKDDISLESVFNLWSYDRDILCALSSANIKKCLQEIAEYFASVSEEDVTLDLVNNATKKALNSAARGVSISDIEKLLDEVFTQTYVGGTYDREFEMVKRITLNRCKEMINYDVKEDN